MLMQLLVIWGRLGPSVESRKDTCGMGWWRMYWNWWVQTVYFLHCTFTMSVWGLMLHVCILQISKCDVCQWMNRKLTTGSPALHPIPVKTTWYQIGIDFMGPLSPTAEDGSRYILTITDFFFKVGGGCSNSWQVSWYCGECPFQGD